MNKELKKQLIKIKEASPFQIRDALSFRLSAGSEPSQRSAIIVNLFGEWYKKFGFVGCSSHSGRRSFVTQLARKVSSVGGSLRDFQALAGNASLTTTSRYIETDAEP